MLRAIQLGMADRDATETRSHALQGARLAPDAVVKAGGLDQPGVPPAVEHDRLDIAIGFESERAE